MLNSIISKLMRNDSNASWDECTTLEEVKEGLICAMEGYSPEEETYKFYQSILCEIN